MVKDRIKQIIIDTLMNKFKPQLGKEVNYDLIQYPTFISHKLDGIRVIFKNGEMFSRSLKPIRNVQLHKRFAHLKEFSKTTNTIFDGEFYSHKLTFQEITSQVMSKDKPLDDTLEFHCFDCIVDETENMPFWQRHNTSKTLLLGFSFIKIVYHLMVSEKKEIDKSFETALKRGYEGLILRNPQGRYKFGRSTEREGFLLKIKPFKTFDAEIIGVEERMENLNESETNELGESFKRNTVDAKKGTGIASAFVVKYDGKEMKVTLTGPEYKRRLILQNKEKNIGKFIEYKAMLIGAKDVPRHPVFLRFRKDRD